MKQELNEKMDQLISRLRLFQYGSKDTSEEVVTQKKEWMTKMTTYIDTQDQNYISTQLCQGWRMTRT